MNDSVVGKVTSTDSGVTQWKSVFRLFGVRGWVVAALGGAATLALIGMTTAIIDNPFFTRSTLVSPQDYTIWLLTGLLAGLIAGTFTLTAKAHAGGRAVSGGFLSFLAVSCPVCNKLVLALLGTSGALAFFAPLQIYIGIASLALLAWSLHLRVRAINRNCCSVPREMEARETGISK
ncbi:MAG: hypothetical protein HYX80_05900 [Chloroflexi bacterium]|nr:hypothetical protein [Chloroflexota bacterium]